MFAALPAQAVQPRAHWSIYLFAAGCVAMLVSMALVLAGVPATMFYDIDAKGERNRNHSRDPLKMSQSIDGNMKWIKENSGYEANQYNGLLSSISHSENAVPQMAHAVSSMTAGVDSIDDGLSDVRDTTVQMRADMEAMAKISGSSAGTMGSIGSDINLMAGSMGELFEATKRLTIAMAGIEKKAAGIAGGRTNKALAQTRTLNRSLPDKMPPPTTTMLPLYPEGAV